MAKGKLKDFLGAAWEDGSQALLESNIAQESITEIGSLVVEEGTALAVGSIFAGIMPRVNGIRLTYQQKRFERNVKAAIEVLGEKIELINQKIELLDEETQEKFRGVYVEWLLENMYEERQTEKVKYHITGYIGMMESEITEDFMLIFMETLNQLTTLDIDVLKMYSLNRTENIFQLCERHGIQIDQLELVRQKLQRSGLLYSNNDDQRDSNIDLLADYIEKRVKEEGKKNGDFHKIKLGKIAKVKRSESYSITRLGRDFLDRIL